MKKTPDHNDALQAPRQNTAAGFILEQHAQGKKANRLINEKSPYLLQHAFNPVDWHPWGEEAFALAKKLDRPIFLSIGYSTCHWCHVMAHESFEDPEIAGQLNRDFIPIKIDREERPDLDQIYMAAAQALSESSGWPLSICLTPDLKPFYSGTYFPPRPRHGMPGFGEILHSLQQIWTTNRERVEEAATGLTEHLQANLAPPSQAEGMDGKLQERAMQQYQTIFDVDHGGFGPAPKFPRPVTFTFLLHHHLATGNYHGRFMVTHTLDKMAAGGIYDHLGGGFHRYSVDRFWLVPHFEKMLYDQAQLATTYLEAFQLTGKERFAQVARETLDYVLRDLSDPEGGFYSGEDADSPLPDQPEQQQEGAFYLWNWEEIAALLDPETASLVCFHYGLKKDGNIESDPHNEFGCGNIIHEAHSVRESARHFKLDEDEISHRLDWARETLLQARLQRPRPHLDDKVLTSWNGLMISALAKGAQILDDDRYRVAAQKAATFLLAKLRTPSGTLLHRYRDSEAGMEAHLTDYAFLIQGLLDLYCADFDRGWLTAALELSEMQVDLFGDQKLGGFFDTSTLDPHRIVRLRSEYEGAEPGGNSTAALNLLRLTALTGSSRWQEMAESTINSVAPLLTQEPLMMPQMLAALHFLQQGGGQVVIVGNSKEADTMALLREVQSRFLPWLVLIQVDAGDDSEETLRLLPTLTGKTIIQNRATAYVCRQQTCLEPTTDPAELAQLLSAK